MKRACCFLIIATTLLFPAFAKERSLPPVEKMISLTDLTFEITDELVQGKIPNMAIECKEGAQLPLRFFANYDLFSIGLIPNLTVRIEKTCYFRFIGKKGFISYDLQNWEKGSKLFYKNRSPRVKFGIESSQVLIESHLENDI